MDTAQSQPTNSEDLASERRIDLGADWAFATWRPRTKTLPEPFDRQACAARLARIGASNQGWDWHWEQAGVPTAMTADEAAFWLTARFEATGNTTPAELAAKLARPSTSLTYSAEQILGRLQANGRILQDWFMPVLARFLTFEQLAGVLQNEEVVGRWSMHHYFLAGFLKHVVPHAGEAELDKLRTEVRPRITPDRWPTSAHVGSVHAFHLAACLGMHAELAAVVSSWPDERFAAPIDEHNLMPQYVVFGLGDGPSVSSHMRRLKLKLKNSQHVRAWLACTEYEGLDLVHDAIVAAERTRAADLVKTLGLVKAPETAPIMLKLMQTGVATIVVPARAWLGDNPLCAIHGLFPLARRGSKIGEAAIQVLRDLRRRGHQDYMERFVSRLVADGASRVCQDILAEKDAAFPAFDEATTPDWLKEFLTGDSDPRLPDWLRIAELPAIIVGKHRLNDSQIVGVLDEIQSADLRFPRSLFTALRQHATPDSLDAFAWDLFERWQGVGFPAKEKWALAAIGFLGGDASVLKLTPLLRVWPGQSQHDRASHGLDCLRAVGSETALMQLHSIAQKLQYRGLKARARECMESIAAERGMTAEDLEDRIVPDCGLDAQGGLVFDYGPRRFTLAVGKDLKPMVRDESGKLLASLPRPTAKDTLAPTAAASWNLLKKTLREVLKMQCLRLERAMVHGRRWTRDLFESQLVRHPLMSHLVRRLVWGSFERGDILQASFRVTDERDFADVKDQPLQVGTCIGIVHPAQLSAAETANWTDLISEYEIIAPFPQLGRPIYKARPGEEGDSEITRFRHVHLEPRVLTAILDRQGWKREAAGGSVLELPFPNADITAILECNGTLPFGATGVTTCYFVPGGGGNKNKRLKLGDVHPVALSEVLRYLNALQNAAK